MNKDLRLFYVRRALEYSFHLFRQLNISHLILHSVLDCWKNWPRVEPHPCPFLKTLLITLSSPNKCSRPRSKIKVFFSGRLLHRASTLTGIIYSSFQGVILWTMSTSRATCSTTTKEYCNCEKLPSIPGLLKFPKENVEHDYSKV